MTTEPAGIPPRKRAPRSLNDVQTADPTALAMMTRAQVDALPATARARRREILQTDTTTRWGLPQIMAYCHAGRAAVSRWRWHQLKGDPVNGRYTVLPPPLPPRPPDQQPPRRRGGRRGAEWLMSQIVTEWAPDMERCDRIDFVAFPEGRKRPGRTPDAERPPQAPPAQRSAPASTRTAVDA